MNTARYLLSCVDYSVLQELVPDNLSRESAERKAAIEKVIIDYSDVNNFIEDAKKLEKRAKSEGLQTYLSSLVTRTYSWGSDDGEKEIAASNLFIKKYIPYLGWAIAADFRWTKGGKVEVVILSVPSIPPTSGIDMGMLKTVAVSGSLDSMYDQVKPMFMESFDKILHKLKTDPSWTRYMVATPLKGGGMKFINWVDPTRINDQKYLNKQFTKKQIEDIRSGTSKILQGVGIGREYQRSDNNVLACFDGRKF